MANKLDKKPERLMQIERFLSQTKVMIILLAVADLFFFFCRTLFLQFNNETSDDS